MKKKKVAVMRTNNIWESNIIKITKEHSDYYFEIGREITIDLAEAISIMMRLKSKWNDDVWNIQLGEIDYYNIDPSKCLYWLSGGDEEWILGNNYKKYWHECQLEFQEEFGLVVLSILKKSKTMKDIRDGFLKHLNLTTLYDFAIDKKIV